MPTPAGAKRVLKNLDVQFISLVDAGANQRTVLYKSAGAADAPTFNRTVAIAKTDDEKRLVYGVVYAPDSVDSHGDAMDAAEIEKAAHAFMQAGRTTQVDKQHDSQADEGAVVESWLTKGADPLFPDEPEGTWCVAIKVADDETWAAIKKGEITGLSMAGTATAETVEKADAPRVLVVRADADESLVVQLVKAFTGGTVAAVVIEKDFASANGNRLLMSATYALEDAIRGISYDETITDKKSAVVESVQQFLAYIEAVFAASTVATLALSKGAVEPGDTDAPAPVAKDAVGARLDEIVKLLAQVPTKDDVEALAARVEAVEKASPGRQSTLEREPVQKEESFRGLRLVGG